MSPKNASSAISHTAAPRRVKEQLTRAGYRLASVQAILQNPGEAINDDARIAADMDLEDVRAAIVVAMGLIK